MPKVSCFEVEGAALKAFMLAPERDPLPLPRIAGCEMTVIPPAIVQFRRRLQHQAAASAGRRVDGAGCRRTRL